MMMKLPSDWLYMMMSTFIRALDDDVNFIRVLDDDVTFRRTLDDDVTFR